MYKYVLISVVKISMMFANYLEYYTITIFKYLGAVFLWTRPSWCWCLIYHWKW